MTVPALPDQPQPLHVDEHGTPHYANSADGLHVTLCAVCGQVDDHPKHGFILHAQTGRESRRHKDCCAASGCDACAREIAGAPPGTRGHAMRAHIQNFHAQGGSA